MYQCLHHCRGLLPVLNACKQRAEALLIACGLASASPLADRNAAFWSVFNMLHLMTCEWLSAFTLGCGPLP